MRRNAVKAILGFTFAMLIIAAFTWVVGWADILNAIAMADTPLLGTGLLVSFGGLLLLGVTWWVVIRTVAGYTLRDGMRVFFATQFANAVTPLGQLGGEPFIAYILSRDSDIPIEEGFGAVLAADVINAVQFFSLSFLGIVIFLVYFPLDPLVATVLKLILGLVVIVAAAFILLWTRKRLTLHLLGRVGKRLRWVFDHLGIDRNGASTRRYLMEKGENFYAILEQVLQQERTVAVALVSSHVAGLAWVAGLYLILLSLGVDAPLSALLFVLPASMLAGYLPLPGGLGGIEVALTALLTGVAGVPLAAASAAALLFRVATYWTSLVIGGYEISRFSVDVFAER